MWEQIHWIVGAIVAIVTGLASIAGVIAYVLQKINSITLQIQRVGEDAHAAKASGEESLRRATSAMVFALRRGELEAMEKGLLTADGTISTRARERYGALVPKLKALYELYNKTITDPDLASRIEDAMGTELVEQICKPLQIHDGACLALAIRLIREMDRGGPATATTAVIGALCLCQLAA